jgi:pyridoxal phosphate enzyme (YggS family)
VSKTVDMPEIACAQAAGQKDFGENRSLLLRQRQEAVPEARWHFIGSIQTNKVKDFVGRAALVHSVASERALVAIAQRAQALELQQDVLIEVNVSGEGSKDGIAPDLLHTLLGCALREEGAGIVVRGLMTMAPQGDARRAREVFRRLRLLRDEYAERYRMAGRVELRELSMGMSEDYLLAIEEGATIVRIGRTIWA